MLIGISTNKRSINKSKTIFFHKQKDWNKIPLKLPDLTFNNIFLKKVTIEIYRCDDHGIGKVTLRWLKLKSQKILEFYLKVVCT